MALRRGFAAVREAKKESDANRAAYEGMRTRDLILREDGEEAELWFIGTQESEPCMVKTHTLRGVGKVKFRTDICATGFHGHAGCVYCYMEQRGDKRIGKSRKNGVFTVVDTRFVHKQKNEAKTAETGGKYERFDFFECGCSDEDPDPSECKYCKRKIPRERRGLCRARYGIQNLVALDGLNEGLARKCLNCGGKIKITSYKNEAGKVLADLEDAEDPEEWTAQYACRKCDDPKPGNIFSCPITVRRNGTGESTSYTFMPGAPDMPPDWVLEFEPLDLPKILVPRSAEKQAELLGVTNPFEPVGGESRVVKGTRKGASDYNESSEDPFDNS